MDPRRRLVAAAHAGWRGTAAGVAARAVAALVARGSRPEDLVAALGPGIGACCYEVGTRCARPSLPSGAAFFRPGPSGRPHLDVRAANVRQLLDAGLRPEALHHVADCTRCRADLYHSYRRDGRAAGRMISFVGFAPIGRSPAARAFEARSSTARLASASASRFRSRGTWATRGRSKRARRPFASRWSGCRPGFLTR